MDRPAASYNLHSGSHQDSDPAARIPGMPPNMGEDLLPHVVTFQGILASVSRVYRPSDEALKNSYDNARFMLNDLVVTECVDQRRRSLCLLNWHLEPEDQKDPQQKELAAELTRIIKKIPHFMKYRESLAYANWYGRYANQQRYRWLDVRGTRRVCIDRWLPVNGDKIVFRYDDGTREYDPDQIGIRVGAGYATSHTVQKTWSVGRTNKVQPTDYGLAYFLEDWERPLIALHKYLIEDGEYEDPMNAGRIHGLGIRSRIYWTWHQKQETLAWLVEYLERSALGMEIWYYPWGSVEGRKQAMKAAQERIGQGRNIVLVPRPIGEESSYGVERIEPGMAGAEVIERIIKEYFGHLIKRYILGQTMTTEAVPGSLGSGQGDVHLDTYMQIVRYDATNMEETLTTDLVDPIKIFNFPKYAHVPVYFRIDTEAPDVDKKLSAWKDAYEMGLKLKSGDVYDLIGASKPEATDETIQSPEAAQAAAQQQGSGVGSQGSGQGDYRGRSQVAMPGSDAQALWREIGKKQDARSMSAALGIGHDGASATASYAAGNGDNDPPSENSERERVMTYARDPAGVRAAIATAAEDTAREPSEAQRQAGNYPKGRFTLHGLPITIETPRGAMRRGVSRDGQAWETQMPHHYGYIRQTESEADGDHVDVFIGPDPESELVFVVDQKKPGGRFDEHKVLLGFQSERQAREAYLSAYQAGWQGLSAITALTLPQFIQWLETGDTGRPIARQLTGAAA